MLPFISAFKTKALLQDKQIQNRLAVITGATSGIGKEFATYFAKQGFDLIITGRSHSIYKVASQLIRDFKVNVEVIIANLAIDKELSYLLNIIGNRKNIHVLINNAGYGLDSKFSNDGLYHQMEMLKVHVNAPLMIIHKVLPVMMKNNEGVIINVSSLAAFMPMAGNGMYASTKSFLKNFSESLHLDVSNYGIRVQCLCPGFTHTNFHADLKNFTGTSNSYFIPWMSPSSVVQYSIKCLDKGKVICIPGFFNRIFKVIINLIPRQLYYYIIYKLENKSKKHSLTNIFQYL